MNSSEAWTVGRLLNWTTDYLKKEGSSSPRLDAEVLLAHARGCSRVQLYTAFDEVADDDQRATFRELVKRRAEGEPVAYLVGYKEFYSARFEITPDVLIPRPETEHLILAALDCGKQLLINRDSTTPLLVGDVGTGSGIIAITIAKHLPQCRVAASDISPAALEVAQRNAEQHGFDESRMLFFEGDLINAFPAGATFDMVLSNPPYVSEAEYKQLDKSVREFEPKLALVGGESGGEVIERLIAESFPFMNDGGYLIFEFSPMLAERLPQLLSAQSSPDQWHPPRIIKDFAGHARVVVLQKTSTHHA